MVVLKIHKKNRRRKKVNKIKSKAFDYLSFSKNTA